jgi:hypothetical protein
MPHIFYRNSLWYVRFKEKYYPCGERSTAFTIAADLHDNSDSYAWCDVPFFVVYPHGR